MVVMKVKFTSVILNIHFNACKTILHYLFTTIQTIINIDRIGTTMGP